MQVTTSYKTKIVGYNNIFKETLAIYHDALAYLIKVVDAEWDKLVQIRSSKLQMTYIEQQVHATAKNIAAYDFDDHFYKFPSYLRRSAIADAIGKVSSYRKNYSNWCSAGGKGRPPKLQVNHFSFPSLFRGNMFIRLDDYTAQAKIYKQNDWVWLTVKLRKSDVDYIIRHKATAAESSPTLYRSGKKWFLRFAFTNNVELAKTIDVITAVDLGINNAATCSAMLPDGTIIGRKVISFPVEQDQMKHKLNKVKKAQQHGARSMPRLWAYVNNINRTIAEKTAKAVIDFASLYDSETIVFEHLDFSGKKKGSKKQRLHLWRKKAVLAMATTKAHLLGMRISTVCAWNTSKLAFDGSGIVERDEDNYSLCTFQNGKRYHCDLSASYNIGARYYIRETLKSLPVRERLVVEAKVPQLARRTTCTLSDLINLCAELTLLAG